MYFLVAYLVCLSCFIHNIQAELSCNDKSYSANLKLTFELSSLFEKTYHAHQNYIFSTLSLQDVFKPLLLLSDNETVETYNRFFGFSKSKLLHCLESDKGDKKASNSILHSVSKIWLDKNVKIVDSELNDVLANYIKYVDIKKDNVKTLKQINQWVEEHTDGNIKNLIDQNSLNSNSHLVITNAVAFKGRWKFPFELLDEKREFHTFQKTIKLKMMAATMKVYHYHSKHMQMIELPYDKSNFVMNVIISKAIKLQDFSNAVQNMKVQKVKVVMPIFDIVHQSDMKPYIKKLGVSIFDQNLKYIKPASSVSSIIQKVKLSVDEKGTKASAGSAVVTGRSMMPMFIVDRPFYVILRNTQDKSISFFGKIVLPKQTE